MKKLLALLLLAAISVDFAVGLKCFVGKGNASLLLPATEAEQEKHEKEQRGSTEFKIAECGTRNSQVVSIDQLVRDVKKKIKQSIEGALNKAAQALNHDRDSRRRKRHDDDERYACIKIVMNDEAIRSCVPKVSDLQMNCTAGTGQLSLCYCHENNCNTAERTAVVTAWRTLILAAVPMAAIRFFGSGH